MQRPGCSKCFALYFVIDEQLASPYNIKHSLVTPSKYREV